MRLWSCRLGFDSESGQTNDFKTATHSFPARRSALKGQCEEQADNLFVVPLEKTLSGISPSSCG